MAIIEELPELITQYSVWRFTLSAPMYCVWNVVCNITVVRTIDVASEKILYRMETPQVSNNYSHI